MHMTNFKSNVIICKTPRNDGLGNLLSLPADHYQSAQFYMDFTEIHSIEEIVDRFEWMESRGYHLRNDRGWVYRSENIAKVVFEIYEYSMHTREIHDHAIRLLTRSGNLRQQVAKLIENELDKLPNDDGEEE